MSAAEQPNTQIPAAREAAPTDSGERRILLIGVALLVIAAFLPWLVVKPNRLAPGEYQTLSGAWRAGLLLFAALLAGLGWWRAWLGSLLANVAIIGGAGALGLLAAAGLNGQLASTIGRAGASSGFWLWLLGSAVALSGAGQALRGRGRALLWPWLPGLLLVLLLGGLDRWSVVVEARTEGPRLIQEFWQHTRLVLAALALALLIGGPLAVWAAARARVAGAVLGFANAVQTIPSLALLGLMIAPLAALANAAPWLRQVGVSGIGVAPALVAMTLYALLPVLRNGVVSLRGVDGGALDAARGMGMTGRQRFWRVALPLALPVWLAGVRQAAVLLVGVASVAALIGAGGLGVYVFRGLQSAAPDLILLGAIPACALALAADGLLRALEGWLGRRLGRQA